MTNNSEILAVNDAFYRAFEKKDIEAMSAVWSQGNGSLCIHPGWDILRGWKAISTSWQKIFNYRGVRGAISPALYLKGQRRDTWTPRVD
jgi:hypothetical protein